MSAFAARELEELEIAINEAASALLFVQKAYWLRPRLNAILNWENIQGETKTTVSELLASKDVQLSSIYRSAFITFCGALEQFIRKVTEQAVKKIQAECMPFEKLPRHIADQNLYRTGKVISKYFSPLDHIKINYDRISSNLASCVTGQHKYTLNAEVFSYFISNAGSDQIADIFSWIGLKLDWDDFGKEIELQSFFNLKTKTRDTSNKVKEELDRFISIRNKVAHGGIGGVSVTESDISHYAQFILKFGKFFLLILENKLKKLILDSKKT